MRNYYQPPFARDNLIMLAGSLLVSQLFISIGTQENWFELIQQNNYWPDTLFVFSLSYLLWLAVRLVSGKLQGIYDWMEHPFRRISLQCILGIILPALFCAACVVAYYSWYYQIPVSKTTFPAYEFPLSVVLVVQFNLYYLIYYFYRKTRDENLASPATTEQNATRKSLVGSMGRKNVPVELSQVAHIFIRDSIVYLTTFDGTRLTVNYTLEEVFNLLDTSEFFRTNRQVIINRKSCKSFLSEANGKLLVELVPAMDEHVIISQLKASEFKKWIEAG